MAVQYIYVLYIYVYTLRNKCIVIDLLTLVVVISCFGQTLWATSFLSLSLFFAIFPLDLYFFPYSGAAISIANGDDDGELSANVFFFV